MEHLPNSEPMKPRAWKGFAEFDRMIAEGLAQVVSIDVVTDEIELPEEM